MGYIVQRGGIGANPAKLKVIDRGHRTSLGSAHFLAWCNTSPVSPVPKSEPNNLYPMLRMSNPFIWTPDYEKAFENPKNMPISFPVLTQFDPQLKIIQKTDTSIKQGMATPIICKLWTLADSGHGRHFKLQRLKERHTPFIFTTAIENTITTLFYLLISATISIITD